jgi:hypothetical protein
MALGCKYGSHRVIEPLGALPQTAQRIDNDMSTVYDNEILLDVIALNVDSASFTQIEEEAGGDVDKIGKKIMEIVAARGKQQNPVTGSGGMFIGKVLKIGSALKDRDLKVGDKIASLVSLSLTPLKINKILKVMPEVDRVLIDGQAILFESGIYAKLPTDMDEGLALAALDVAGAPAQTAKLVKPGDSVLVMGAGGKSGMMCCYEAMKRVGPTGRVIANIHSERSRKALRGHEARPRGHSRRRHQALGYHERHPEGQWRQGSQRGHQLREHPGHRDGQHTARARRRHRIFLQHGHELYPRRARSRRHRQGLPHDHRQRLYQGPRRDYAVGTP